MKFQSHFPLPYKLELLKRINVTGKEASNVIGAAKSDALFWTLETFTRAKRLLTGTSKPKKRKYKFHREIEII